MRQCMLSLLMCNACVLTSAKGLAVVPLLIGIAVPCVSSPQHIPWVTTVVGNCTKLSVRAHRDVTIENARQQTTVSNCVNEQEKASSEHD